MANTLSWGKHDTQGHAVIDWDTDSDGYTEYVYHSYFVEWQAVGRLILDPHPYMPGHEDQLRITGDLVTAPEDVAGSSFLQIWAYDRHTLPAFYAYTPFTRRVRSLPVDQRFEPLFPGNTYFATEYWMAGDRLLTWGNFRLVSKGPVLTCAHHCADLENVLAPQNLRRQQRHKVLSDSHGACAGGVCNRVVTYLISAGSDQQKAYLVRRPDAVSIDHDYLRSPGETLAAVGGRLRLLPAQARDAMDRWSTEQLLELDACTRT